MITASASFVSDYARRDAEHRAKYPTPAGGYWENMRRITPDRLKGTAWFESSSSSTYVVFDGYSITQVFKGDEAHRRAGEFVGQFGGTRIPAIRR